MNKSPTLKARAIAFYLPQYHPIPENDAFWGKGFTEWSNVAKARPLFRGHIQPHLPGDLGFYDLRVPEIRKQQAELAKKAGIEGFCYWHYWFGDGKRALERIFDEVINTGQPDFPFCLGWANESWTGRWHGLDSQVIFEQTYPGIDDYIQHFRKLLPAFLDKRYMHVDGSRIFLIYRPELIPDLSTFLTTWNDLAKKNGLQSFFFISVNDDFDHRPFPEIAGAIPRHIHKVIMRCQRMTSRNFIYNLLAHLGCGRGPDSLSGKLSGRYPLRASYKKFLGIWDEMEVDEKTFPCIFPNWDNTARSKKFGYVFYDSTPENFQKTVKKALKRVADRPPEKRLVFFKSWNEWAEGNYMEPDAQHGKAYLDALASEIFN